MTEPRKYTLRIEVEIRDQDDFKHFQPDTVTASAPQLGVEWVSSGDSTALCDFFHFYLTRAFESAPMSEVGARIGAIARRALDDAKGKDEQAAMLDIIRHLAAEISDRHESERLHHAAWALLEKLDRKS